MKVLTLVNQSDIIKRILIRLHIDDIFPQAGFNYDASAVPVVVTVVDVA